MMAGMDLGSRAIREQIASAIQLIVYQQRLKDGTRRFTHVTEVAGMEGEVITLQDIFLFDFSAGMDDEGRFRGRLKSTGLRRSSSTSCRSAASTSTRSSSRWKRGAARCWQPDVLLQPGDAPGRRRARRAGGVRARLAPAGDGRARQGGPGHGGADGRDRTSGAADAATAVDKPGTGWIPESVSSFGERFAQSRGFSEKLDGQLEAAGVSLRRASSWSPRSGPGCSARSSAPRSSRSPAGRRGGLAAACRRSC